MKNLTPPCGWKVLHTDDNQSLVKSISDAVGSSLNDDTKRKNLWILSATFGLHIFSKKVSFQMIRPLKTHYSSIMLCHITILYRFSFSIIVWRIETGVSRSWIWNLFKKHLFHKLRPRRSIYNSIFPSSSFRHVSRHHHFDVLHFHAHLKLLFLGWKMQRKRLLCVNVFVRGAYMRTEAQILAPSIDWHRFFWGKTFSDWENTQ